MTAPSYPQNNKLFFIQLMYLFYVNKYLIARKLFNPPLLSPRKDKFTFLSSKNFATL